MFATLCQQRTAERKSPLEKAFCLFEKGSCRGSPDLTVHRLFSEKAELEEESFLSSL